MDWLNVWINTFLKKLKLKYDVVDGVKSVVYASVIVGALSFLGSLFSADNNPANSFVMNVIALPIICLLALAVFIAVFRWVAGMHKGNGTFSRDFATAGVYLGSLIFVGGIFMFLWGMVMGVVVPATTDTSAALNVNFFVVFLVMGVMVAVMAFLGVTVFGVWLEELAAIEKLGVSMTAKAMGMAGAIILFAAFLILGGITELAYGPYKEMLAQYGTITGA